MSETQEESKLVAVAARHGQVSNIIRLIQEGHPIDVMDNRGWRPTHEAAHGNHSLCLQQLLKQEETNVNWQSHDGATALLVASGQGNLDSVQMLLESGADANLPDHVKTYPLYAAVRVRSLPCVQLLLQHDANINCKSHCGSTPMHFAAAKGYYDVIQHLLEMGAALDAREDYDITPIFSSAHSGHADCLQLMLDWANKKRKGYLVNFPAEDGGTPLYLAAQEGHIECVQVLLKYGANANLITANPTALPLHAALQFSHIECVRLLFPVTNLAKVKECDASLYDMAFSHQSTDCTECLLKLGLDVNSKHLLLDDEFEPKILRYIQHNLHYSRYLTPLAWCTISNYDIKHAKLLLGAGANVNTMRTFELPPLLAAINACRINLMELLIRHSSDVNHYHPNVKGNLSLVLCLHFWRGMNLLLHCGAEAESLFTLPQDSSGDPFSNQSFEAVERLLIPDRMTYPDSDKEEEVLSDRVAQPLTLYEILSAGRYLMGRTHVRIDQLLGLLLHFVRDVQLDPRLESILDGPHLWPPLLAITESPRSLMHYSRYVIRKCLGPQRLLDCISSVKQLPLPQMLLEYVMHVELNGLVRSTPHSSSSHVNIP